MHRILYIYIQYYVKTKSGTCPVCIQIPRAVWLAGLDCQERQLSIRRIVRGDVFYIFFGNGWGHDQDQDDLLKCWERSSDAILGCTAQYGIQSYFTERNGNFETGHVASIQRANVDMTEYLHPGIPLLSSPTPLSSFAKISSLLRNDIGAAEEAANPRPQQKIRRCLCQHLALHNPQANRLVESEAKLHSTEFMQKIIATM